MIEIKNLQLDFRSDEGAFRAIDGMTLTIESGNTLCLVGESGSGKSVTALSLARLLPSPPAHYAGGEILVEGRDVLRMTARELRQIRGHTISYIFQDPAASLNPVLRVGEQIREMLALHRPAADTREEIVRLLQLVGISAAQDRADDYPHQMSGGMQQRVMIAMAIASRPKLLVADEPTTALDVTIQAQIIELLRDLQARLGMGILLITHHLGIVSEIADRVAVLYAGQIVELAPAGELLQRPLHPYTQALIESVPKIGAEAKRLRAIPGTVPPPGALRAGCRFAPRCAIARPECERETPALLEVKPSHWVRCPYHASEAPPQTHEQLD